MDRLGQYILSVTLTAMICAIVTSIAPSETSKNGIRLICGLILTITVLTPISQTANMELTFSDPIVWSEGKDISAEGQKQSHNDMAEIIKAQSEAYIVDKAAALGVDITASISVSDDTIPIPVSVELGGSLSDYQRLSLEGLIQDNLDITKENIRWMD